MLFTAGLPVFFLEMSLGQYTGAGPIQIFGRMAPVLKGLGYVSVPAKMHLGGREERLNKQGGRGAIKTEQFNRLVDYPTNFLL